MLPDCSDFDTQEKWDTLMLEAWIKNVVGLWIRAGLHDLKTRFEGKTNMRDDIYIAISENLDKEIFHSKISSLEDEIPHSETVAQYVRSTEALQ